MHSIRAFTLLDLLAVVLILAVAAFFLLPPFCSVSQPARRASCMMNVRQIGLAMFQYAGDHDDHFMRLVDANGNVVPAVDNEGHVSVLPSRTAFALLLKDGYITTTKVFVCPSSTEQANPSFPTDFKNTPLQKLVFSDEHCSYGCDPTKAHSVDASCAIVADKPPVGVSKANEGTVKNNSDNHKGEGQNIFYNDGHVKWSTTPGTESGTDPDIYTGGPDYWKSKTDVKIIR